MEAIGSDPQQVYQPVAPLQYSKVNYPLPHMFQKSITIQRLRIDRSEYSNKPKL